MSERSPTRAALLELQDERHAMHEGHAFLDEKCLLLAGRMLHELQAHAALARALQACHEAAMQALQTALGRHGLDGLQVQPAAAPGGQAHLEATRLMGVALLQAHWQPDADADAARASAPLVPSPETERCREAFAALRQAAVPMAAVGGNLERLSQEYRRSVRRARALHDVLLPELEREWRATDSALEELEQQDLISMRVAGAAAGAARVGAGAWRFARARSWPTRPSACTG